MSLARSSFFVIIALAILVFGLFALAYRNRTIAITGGSQPAPFSSFGNLLVEQGQDSDNDGLLDWAEAVWGTDPKNPDTDGDGYPDGQEVAKGYDPTKPGEARLSIKSTPLASDQNITQSLAATLAQQVIAHNQSQLADPNQKIKDLAAPSFDETGVAKLLSEVLPQGHAFQPTPAQTLPPKNLEGRRYALALISILDAELKPLAASVPTALEAAAVRGDTKGVDSIIQAHSRAIRRLENLTPPAGWQQVHEAEQRLLAESKRFFEDISRAKDDPLRAILAMRRYPELASYAQKLERVFSAALL